MPNFSGLHSDGNATIIQHTSSDLALHRMDEHCHQNTNLTP